MAAKLGDFAEPIVPVSPQMTGAEIYERFQREPGVLAIPVADAAGLPLGLVDRNEFFIRMGAEFGRALYAHKPVTAVMDPDPVLAEADDPAEPFFDATIEADSAVLMRGFIVTRQGCYLGVGTPLKVMQASFALNRRRADEMETLAQNLAWAEAEAQASSRAKSQFLAVMSHEIRTPLNGVLAVAEIIERRLQQEDLRPYVRTVLNSGETLLRLLTDALDLSRAEAGSMKLEEEPCDLAVVLADLDALWRSKAEAQGLDFTTHLQGELDDWVLADEVRLKQVLNNLIGNALKFTESGAVRVCVESRRTDVYTALTCTISDTGPGISPAELESIFEPFSTGAERRRGAGAGLGLAICEQIVEAMGGRISVQSDLGRGTAFVVELQLFSVPRPAVAHVDQPQPTLASPLHVLVVDDNVTNRLVAGTLLEIFGCTYQTAEDGVEAIDLARDGAFDVILMDIQMPRMDGVRATRAIRQGSGRCRAVPIIALTANADPGDAADYLAAGMDAVVEKPLKPASLLRALADLQAGEPASERDAA